jgi:riboflavin kinase/FMN adenylyltransferase
VEIIKPLYIKTVKISTSYIKELLSKGDIKTANKLLDKPFYIKGIVKRGKQLGRQIGFPTMNISNNEIFYPRNGVYITKTTIKNIEYKSMTYVEFPIIESYLINYNKFQYNFKIRVDFFAKIRDNKVFKDHNTLILQLNKDLTKIKDYFNIAGDF